MVRYACLQNTILGLLLVHLLCTHIMVTWMQKFIVLEMRTTSANLARPSRVSSTLGLFKS
jgi:hypothetical protein